jgi:uncharacterized protein YbbK (DUF523 family)
VAAAHRLTTQAGVQALRSICHEVERGPPTPRNSRKLARSVFVSGGNVSSS